MSRTRKRQPTGSKAFDPSCRNHGSCPWCLGNRKAKELANVLAAQRECRDWLAEHGHDAREAAGVRLGASDNVAEEVLMREGE